MPLPAGLTSFAYWILLLSVTPSSRQRGGNSFHASGHLSRSELETMVREVNADQGIPVHTEHPELFRGLAGKVTLPHPGRPIPV